mmetsp:Transcript_42132/g.111023  ORF Transcript_42132/g.111023 Transcript_42132/m.111023 type:complete len:972 (-) Transcript_42132:369-3284(-)
MAPPLVGSQEGIPLLAEATQRSELRVQLDRRKTTDFVVSLINDAPPKLPPEERKGDCDEATLEGVDLNERLTADDVREMYHHVFVHYEDAAFNSKNFPEMWSLQDRKEPFTRRELIRAVNKDIVSFLREYMGFDLQWFLSVDQDEIFLRLSLKGEETLKAHAEAFRTGVHVDPMVLGYLGIIQDSQATDNQRCGAVLPYKTLNHLVWDHQVRMGYVQDWVNRQFGLEDIDAVRRRCRQAFQEKKDIPGPPSKLNDADRQLYSKFSDALKKVDSNFASMFQDDVQPVSPGEKTNMTLDPLDCWEPMFKLTAPGSQRLDRAFLKQVPTALQTYATGSTWRTVDSVRLINLSISRHLDLADMKYYNLISQAFACHNREQVTFLRSGFGKVTPFLLFEDMAQWIPLIRNYYGESLAHRYAWLCHVGTSLGWLAIFGCVIKVTEVATEWYGPPSLSSPEAREAWMIIYGAIVIIWFVCVEKYWRRTQEKWATLWGGTASVESPARPDFEGALLPSEINSRQVAKWMDRKTRSVKVFVGYLLSGLYIAVMLGLAGYVYDIQDHLVEEYETVGKIAAAFLLGMVISGGCFVWEKLARKIVAWENPRTDDDFTQDLIWKLWPVQCVVAYNSFVYIAFFKRYTPTQCLNGNCLAEVRLNLYMTFASYACICVATTIVNALLQRFMLMQEVQEAETRNQTKKIDDDGRARDFQGFCARHGSLLVADKKWQEAKADESTPAPGFFPAPTIKISYIEEQGKMGPYQRDEQITDMMGMVIQLGFLMFFGAIAPGISGIMFVAWAIQLKTWAWKLTNSCKRTLPRFSDGIGQWNNVMSVVGYCGIVVTIAVAVFGLEALNDMSISEKAVLFCLAEHSALGLRYLCNTCISDTDFVIGLLKLRASYVSTRLLLGAHPDSTVEEAKVSHVQDPLPAYQLKTPAKTTQLPEGMELDLDTKDLSMVAGEDQAMLYFRDESHTELFVEAG